MPKAKTAKTKSALNLLCAAFIVVTLLVAVFIHRPKDCLEGYREDLTIRSGSYSMIVERTDSALARQTGLSGRKCIFEKTGMLFVFDQPDFHGIWMKDMNFPIDILWLDSTKKIVHIEKEVDPNTFDKVFYPSTPASYVLEISAGEVDRAGFALSDQLSW